MQKIYEEELAEEAKSLLLGMDISYDGSYPNLCRGNLTVTIGDRIWTFPSCCMESGGGIQPNYAGTYQGQWRIDEWPKDFPESLKEKVLEKVNDEISMGCCGGCI